MIRYARSTGTMHERVLDARLLALRRASAGASCLAVLCGAMVMAPARAMDISLSVGHSTRHVTQTEVGLLWDTGYQVGDPTGWHAKLYLGGYLGWWHPTSGRDPQDIVSIGASPVVRLQKDLDGWTPFFEVSVGPRLMSHTAPSDGQSFSTALQLAETAGVGFKFGSHRQYQVGYRFEHVSNGGIKKPNPGFNFHQVYVQYTF